MAIEYRNLGSTGVKVSPLCLGAMMFGAWGNTDHEDSIRIIHRALDAGINFIDTADVYSRGESEEIVGSVDEVDAGVEGPVDDADGVIVIGVAPGAEHHRAQAQRAHHHAGAAEAAVFDLHNAPA